MIGGDLPADGDTRVRRGFDHPGLFYDSAEQYVAESSAFVRAAVAGGDAVLVAVPEQNLRLLRSALADVADRVRFADMRVAGRNPGRILPGVLLPFAAEHAGRRVSIIGEPIWAGRSELEYPACAAHEALINAAFAGRDAAILCPYDTQALDRGVIDDACRTHPVLADRTGRRRSPAYADPVAAAAGFQLPLPLPPADAMVLRFRRRAELVGIRKVVAGHATEMGLGHQRAEDFTLAVNELATNTVEHAGGSGRLALWTGQGYLNAQVSDRGRLADPLAGRVPSPPDSTRGRGLVLVNLLCDLVRIHTGPGGTTIRIRMALPQPSLAA
jgi:anti-sigma regulatory factor (Ser/Thr protein kinase)